MTKSFLKSTVGMLGMFALAALVSLSGCSPKQAPVAANNAPAAVERPTLKVGGSIYTGWMMHYHSNGNGVLKAWADKYNMNIEFVAFPDYASSLDAYAAGKVHALTVTNMDGLAIASAAGIDTTAVLMGDFSNGNDAVLVRNGLTTPQLKGKKIYLCEKTVSHYMLVRYLEQNGLSEKDVTIVNVSDSDIAPSFLSSASQEVVVTWNPMVMEIRKSNGITKLFDSSDIPGEVQDLLVVNTSVLNKHPDFARALTGAWYETLNEMSQRGATADAALLSMANYSKCSLDEFKTQLKTTAMFYDSESASKFTKSEENKKKMDLVRQFCAGHSLLGDGVTNADAVGIEYPDGSVQGAKGNVKFRYSSKFMEEFTAGTIKR